MARAPNYNFEKRRKELERKAKKEAKAERKRAERESGRDSATENAETLPPGSNTEGDQQR